MGKKGNSFFKKSHLIAYFAWPLATAHYVLAGTDAMTEWSIALVIAVSVILVFLLLARGFVQPARRAPRPRPTTATPVTGNIETSELPETAKPRELVDTTV
jgi:DMSO/TMAO reductase YedYZ heme-binding membrane subunit